MEEDLLQRWLGLPYVYAKGCMWAKTEGRRLPARTGFGRPGEAAAKLLFTCCHRQSLCDAPEQHPGHLLILEQSPTKPFKGGLQVAVRTQLAFRWEVSLAMVKYRIL